MSHCYRSTRARIAAAATLGLVASAASAQYSTPVRDVENPARTRFMDSGPVVMTPGLAGAVGDIATVPAGKRLVIEQASVRCWQDAGNILTARIVVTQVNGGSSASINFDVPIRYQGVSPFDGRIFVGSMMTRLYADAGTTVRGWATRDGGDGTATCGFAISGHTIVP